VIRGSRSFHVSQSVLHYTEATERCGQCEWKNGAMGSSGAAIGIVFVLGFGGEKERQAEQTE
jgi:hypothetical protein